MRTVFRIYMGIVALLLGLSVGVMADDVDIISITLVTDRGRPIHGFDPVSEGDSVDLAIVGDDISIRVNASVGDDFGSVRSVLSGPVSHQSEENKLPWAVFGDTKKIYHRARLPVGDYTLTCTPYSANNCEGLRGVDFTISFTIVDSRLDNFALFKCPACS